MSTAKADLTPLNQNANQLQGRAVSAQAPSNGQALAWNSVSSSWVPTTGGGGGGVSFPLNAGILGEATMPVYQMIDNDSGMYSEGDGNVSFSANGFKRFQIDQTGSTVTGPLDVTGDITAANYPPTGPSNTPTYFDGSGLISAIPGHAVNPLDGVDINKEIPVQDNGYHSFQTSNIQIVPTEDAPSSNTAINALQVYLDPGNTGFPIGTNGEAATILPLYFGHQGTSSVGTLNFIKTSADIGNGTDPIFVKGISWAYGFGSINDNVILDGPLQGWGFQPSVSSGAGFSDSTSGIRAFYDGSNIQTLAPSYESFIASPIVAGITNNHNYTGLSNNPNIAEFQGNANYFGASITPVLGTFETGGFNGIYINPTITSANSAYGLFVSMDNVTATNKKAAYLDGDVEITGDLSFGGALTIGRLNAFGQFTVVDGGGNPSSVNGLISSITIPEDATTANADTIGLNTAMLLNVGANSNVTLGPLNLFTSLALPSVIETHSGSNLPAVQGGVFALNFSGTSDGGSVGEATAGRFVLIPNGITSITTSIGVKIDNPFGNIASENFGVYQSGAEKNYFEGSVQSAGGLQMKTSGSQPSCSSVTRGMFWNVEGGAGVADQVQVCLKDAADSYSWMPLAM